jgi:large subunit ribosomal protein L23Ae
MKKTEDSDTLMFTTDVKASKHQNKQAMKKLCDMDMAKVNTLLRPDVPLVPGFGRWQQNWNHLN